MPRKVMAADWAKHQLKDPEILQDASEAPGMTEKQIDGLILKIFKDMLQEYGRERDILPANLVIFPCDFIMKHGMQSMNHAFFFHGKSCAMPCNASMRVYVSGVSCVP